MIPPSQNILVIETLSNRYKSVSVVLKENNFRVTVVNTIEEGIQSALNCNFDLIICEHKDQKYSGFHVFKKLEDSLLKNGTSFFICMKKYETEDLLIGLELGIDNFIFWPINEISLLHKVKTQLKKIRESNVFEPQKFLNFYQESPVSMFILENHRIIDVNKSFKEVFNLNNCKQDRRLFCELFDLNGNSNYRMNIKKLENGLIDYCKFENVKFMTNPNIICNIYKFRFDQTEGGKTFVAVVPDNKVSINTIKDYSYQNNRTYPKNIHSDKTIHSNSISITKRENEVLELSVQGFAIKQIASKLALSVRTIEKHRSNIMFKTKTHSIIEAIFILQKNKSFKKNSKDLAAF